MAKYKPFSKEQISRANNVNLHDYLLSRGERLEPHGSEYKLIYTDGAGTHDSIVVGGNTWYDHKNLVGGGTIKFVQQYYGLSFPETVDELLNFDGTSSYSDYTVSYGYRKNDTSAKPKKEFALPPANDNMKRMFAYLCKTRHISSDIVSFFAHEKKLYESKETYKSKATGETKESHNVVFVGKDKNGIARQANRRSMTTFGQAFRATCSGSDTNYGFSHIGTSDRIYVFEAPIDMMSFISLYPENWQQHSYIALDGISHHPLIQTLSDYNHISHIVFCTDNDPAGIDTAERIRDVLMEKGYSKFGRAMAKNKDWNEDLKEIYGEKDIIPAKPHAKKQEYEHVVKSLKPQHAQLTSGLEDLFATGQYAAAAELALNNSVELLKIDDNSIDYDDMFYKLADRLNRQYRAYKDNSTPDKRKKELKTDLDNIYKIKSDDSCRSVAKRLYDIADEAIRLQVAENIAQIEIKAELVVEPAVIPGG
ncbi:MAG: DUF3991 and TOPRIM domain-containing protein [Eubacterium sp.]|nr:DUF3991 and TOPRIM domain-containing protein [Eubacterium sp.]